MAIPLMIAAQRLLGTAPARQTALANPYHYRPGGRHSVVSAGLALTITGGVGAALVLALVAPEVLRVPTGPLIGHPVSDPPPPPPPVDDVTPPEQPLPTTFTLPRPPLVPPTVDAPTAEESFLPPPDPGPTIGTGSGTEQIIDPPLPPAVPVLRGPVRDPRFSDSFQPGYPAAMQRAGTEGACTVGVSIGANGRVTAVRNVACPNDDFFRATQRQALNRWRFTPATRDGVPVEGALNQTVRFEIHE